MSLDFSLLWALLIAFALMMYVIMDGFDLGIGILFPFIRGRKRRDVVVNTVAPVWDGNETWIVFGGAALLGAFPTAYAVLLSALYIPLAIMLIGLIWRGVAFEFRFKADEAHRPFWDKAFSWGSYITAVSQGVALGAFIDGIEVKDGAYAGGALGWLSPFSVFTGLALPVAYALLGVTWLIMKTDGALQARMRVIARPVAVALLVTIAVVSIWSPLAHADVADRWFSLPQFFYLLSVPALVLVLFLALIFALEKKHEVTPFLAALGLLFLGYLGLAISFWPNIVPPGISIWDAAAPASSLEFMLIGAVVVVPCILGYTAWSYFVFRGKVQLGDGYH